MTFRLTTSAYFYEPQRAAELESLGFRFEPMSSACVAMRAYKDSEHAPTIEVASLDDLMAFIAKWAPLRASDQRVVITLDPPTIEIYDDYRE